MNIAPSLCVLSVMCNNCNNNTDSNLTLVVFRVTYLNAETAKWRQAEVWDEDNGLCRIVMWNPLRVFPLCHCLQFSTLIVTVPKRRLNNINRIPKYKWFVPFLQLYQGLYEFQEKLYLCKQTKHRWLSSEHTFIYRSSFKSQTKPKFL